MKLLILSINYHPELTGIGKYNGEMVDWLSKHVTEIKVITAPPYYPAWRLGAGYSAWLYRREKQNNVQVWRCPLWIPKQPSALKRILHLASFALSSLPIALWTALRFRPDVIFVVEPPLFCAPAALLCACLSGAKSCLHVQDFEVDAAFELGILRSPLAYRCVLAAEGWLMRQFDFVSTISARMLDRLNQKGVPAARQVFFPNWVELDRIFPLTVQSPLRREWGIPDSAIVILYSGNMGEKQGIEILIDAARQLSSHTEIHFILCGTGAALLRLKKHAKELNNISFKPLQPIDRLNDLLNLADIHVLPQRIDAADLVLPSKLANMLASGKPIVATAQPGTQVADVLNDCGIVTNPGDVEALVSAIINLAENPILRQRLGCNGNRFAEEHLNRDEILGRFLVLLEQNTLDSKD